MKFDFDTSAIGVDGGGTGCRFALVHRGQRFDVNGAAANASTDLAGTLATLRQGLGELCTKARLEPEIFAQIPAALGLAGVLDTAMAEQITQALPLHRAAVSDDRHTAMAGALGPREGCVIGLGTGSFFGRRADGEDRLIGGWGFTLGDQASGADLGRHALRCTLDVCDGLRAPSPLTQALASRIGAPPDIIAFARTATPGDFAALAPDIVAAAQDGDLVAMDVMRTGAQHIEQSLRQLGWQPPEPVVPIGGLAPHYAPYLRCELTAPQGTALDGALALASRMSETL